MSWAARLLGIKGHGNGQEVRVDVEQAYGRLLMQARGLVRDAGLAPTAGAEAELRALAQEDEAIAAELQEQLTALGGSSPAADEVAPPAALNHWGRVVAAVDQHRISRDQFLETAARLGETAPGLAPLFERLSRAEEAHMTRLRNLVARADPQALD